LRWLHHPKFVSARDLALEQFRRGRLAFARAYPVIFLCGGAKSLVRDRVAEYLRKRKNLLVFYADDVWAQMSSAPGQNALSMEQRLAELADLVALVVESPGTFAELGAFSIHPVLRKKLLPILDLKYKDDPSFINTGPVRWIDSDSRYAPSIWAPMESILSCAAELDARLDKLPAQHERRAKELHLSLKHLLLLVTDVVTVFGPCRDYHVEHYLRSILGREPSVDAGILLALSQSVGLISVTTDPNGVRVFWCRVEHQELRAADHKISPPFSLLRARLVSVMQAIPEARRDLELVASQRGRVK
jgi:hypothetical protein